MSPHAGVPQEHPSPHRGRVTVTALLFGLGAGPAAWVVQLLLDYGLSSYACFPADQALEHAPASGWAAERPVLLAINLACLVLALAGLRVAQASWRGARLEKDGGHQVLLATGEGRSRFLALCGILTAIGFSLAILFDTAAIAAVPSCWNFRP